MTRPSISLQSDLYWIDVESATGAREHAFLLPAAVTQSEAGLRSRPLGEGLLGDGWMLPTSILFTDLATMPSPPFCTHHPPGIALFFSPYPLSRRVPPNRTRRSREKPRGPAQFGYQAWVNNPTNLSVDVLEGCCGGEGIGVGRFIGAHMVLGGPRVGARVGGRDDAAARRADEGKGTRKCIVLVVHRFT